MKQYEYKDYDEYKFVQIGTNHRKVTSVWELESSIEAISNILKEQMGEVHSGICHGTRAGKEQEWFRKYLNADVIGTEISDTATQFPHTVEWDFHEVKDEWIGAFDFVYTNSFDHVYDPDKALKAWASCLKPSGCIIIQWSLEHRRTGSRHDPFGATLGEYIDLAFDAGLMLKEVRALPRNGRKAWAIFLTKNC